MSKSRNSILSIISSDTWVNYSKKQLEELKVVASGEQDWNGGQRACGQLLCIAGLSASMPFLKILPKNLQKQYKDFSKC